MVSKGLLVFGAILFLSACKKGATDVPDVEDQPAVGSARVKDIPDLIPAYGIVEGARLVVSVEAADSPRVRAGQRAWVSVLPSTAPIACRVTRSLRDVSAETNQSLAWLEALSARSLPANSFVAASIEVAWRSHALTVPRAAVMIKDGRTTVLRRAKAAEGKTSFEPVAVTMGVESDGDVEILSGLKPGDEVVTSGGIGLLFPDFKAASD